MISAMDIRLVPTTFAGTLGEISAFWNGCMDIRLVPTRFAGTLGEFSAFWNGCQELGIDSFAW